MTTQNFLNSINLKGSLGISSATTISGVLTTKVGSAGSVTAFAGSNNIIESNTDNYLSLLSPNANARGILFGSPASNVAGTIQYNNASYLNGMVFSTNGNRTALVLRDTGSLNQLLAPTNPSFNSPNYSFIDDNSTGLAYSAGALFLVIGGSDVVDLSLTQVSFTQPIELLDGSAAAPIFRFISDTDTGFYRPANNTIGITLSGVEVVEIQPNTLNSTIPFRGSSGSVSSPTFSFFGDTNTGIFSAGADILSLTTAGAERARFAAAGGLQLGGNSTAPTSTFPVQSGGLKSIANNATATVANGGFNGIIMIISSEGNVAMFYLRGAANNTQELLDISGVYSITQATATSTNVYHDGSNYVIENKRGSTNNYTIFAFGDGNGATPAIN